MPTSWSTSLVNPAEGKQADTAAGRMYPTFTRALLTGRVISEGNCEIAVLRSRAG